MADGVEIAPGVVLQGKYRIDAPLGEGGMGQVWRATHLMLEQAVAIKVLTAGMRADPRAVERMVSEARSAAATGHRNICRVSDLGEDHGQTFFVMELVDGETIDAMVERGPVDVEVAVEIMNQVLLGLSAVHARGLVHRDLKPQNVMVTRNDAGERVVKILDFGLAKPVDPERQSGLTREGAIVGTPAYMAPEQAHGLEVDKRADIYACGVILYTMLVGEEPFVGKSALAVLGRALQGDYRPASERRFAISEVYDQVIGKAMALDPSGRYASADAMRDDLLEALHNGVAPRASGGISGGMVSFGPPASPPSEPSRPTDDDAPDGPLELDLPTDHPRADPVSEAVQSMPTTREQGGRGWLVVLALVAAAAVGVFAFGPGFGDARRSDDTGRAGSGNDAAAVALEVATRPLDVEIYVDDELHVERPVMVPRSENYVRVRVEAAGHHPKTIQLMPSADRRLDVVLSRK